MKYNHTLDATKGILILLVIFGHILSGGELSGYIKYSIYAFHMPLFFGISGFMLKKELFSIPFTDLTKKYFHRLIIPFIFAYVVYSLIEVQLFDPLYPWFHLWFVPAFLLFILYLYIIEYFKINILLMLLISFTFSILWTGYYSFKAEIDGFYFMGDKRFYYDFVFLLFGYYLRNYAKLFNLNWLILSILFVCSAIDVFILNSQAEITFIYSASWVVFNLSLIYITLRLASIFSSIKIPLINQIGQASLPIYLWHIVPLLIVQEIFTGYFYLLSYLVGVSVIIGIVLRLRETKFGKVILFGSGK
ncbi:MAG: acyltransferase family protein [Sulfuricurvum sp.]|nr:acyltransferase family protein [Sulfuricurvum sp.]